MNWSAVWPEVVGGLIVLVVVGVIARVARVPQRVYGRLFLAPRLRMEAREGNEIIIVPDHTAPGGRAGVRAYFAWIAVHNDADRPQADAHNAFAQIEILDHKTGVKLISMRGRWRNSPQPIQTGGDTEGIIDRIEIRAGDRELLDVAMRYEGMADGHALNTEAMRYKRWLKPDYRLPEGDYTVRARVSAENARAVRAKFNLTVSGPKGLTFRRH